ncbi:MAG: hypothetical protein ACLQPD_28065 [Desulfomonilaceae bacterium]
MKSRQSDTTASEFVRDVRFGLSDAALQGKYDIPSNKFYLYKATALDIIAEEDAQKPKNKIEIKAKQFLVDIWSGMDDEALMVKYNLLPRHLQSAFRQIINAGLISPLGLSNRLKITKSQVREAFVEMGKAIRELD